eukprot:3534884-Pleurochrysis_carterae.AAC.1
MCSCASVRAYLLLRAAAPGGVRSLWWSTALRGGEACGFLRGGTRARRCEGKGARNGRAAERLREGREEEGKGEGSEEREGERG